MQWGTSRTWKTDVEEAMRNEQDECGRKKQTGKLTGSKGAEEAEIQNDRFQKEKDINAADYNAPRDATKIVPGKTPRSQSAFITPAESSIYIPRENAARVEARRKKMRMRFARRRSGG